MIAKDLSTQENRDYWAFVEKTAAEVEAMYQRQPSMRAWGEHFLCDIDGGGRCNRGDGTQTCREFLDGTTPGTATRFGS